MVASLAPARVADDELTDYRRNGYHVARGLLSAGEVAEVRDAFMDAAKNGPVPGLSEIRRNASHGNAPAGPSYDPADPLAFYPRMMHPHRHGDNPVGPLATRWMLGERVAGVVRDLMADEPLAAQSMFYFKPPGARGQDLHQDNFYLRVRPGTCVAAWIAVDDADADNGGMVVVPGSGALDVACPEAADRAKFFTDHHVPVPAGLAERQVPLRAGDVLFFNGSLIHGSYPNASADRFRRSLIFHYMPAACEERSAWYSLTRLDGTPVTKADATGGGPCGNSDLLVAYPH